MPCNIVLSKIRHPVESGSRVQLYGCRDPVEQLLKLTERRLRLILPSWRIWGWKPLLCALLEPLRVRGGYQEVRQPVGTPVAGRAPRPGAA